MIASENPPRKVARRNMHPGHESNRLDSTQQRVYKKAAMRAPAPTRLPAMAFIVAAAPVDEVVAGPRLPDPVREPVV